MHEKNPLRFLKRKEVRARRAAELVTATALLEQQRHEQYLADKKERQEQLPAGPGLKEYQVDAYQLFGHEAIGHLLHSGTPHLYKSMAEVVKKEKLKHPEIMEPDYKNYSGNRLYAAAIQTGNYVDRNLRDWITENTPQNGYFTPEMVAIAVEGRDDIRVSTMQRDGLDVWTFNYSDTNESYEMSRTIDGSKPTIPTNPYLEVSYRAEYDFDTEQVVSTPELRDSTTSFGWPEPSQRELLAGAFGDALKQSLEIEPFKADQRVEFTFQGPQSKSYAQIYDGQLDVNFVNVRSSVTAHLPGAEL